MELCSDCEAYSLKKHGLTRFDSLYIIYPKKVFMSHRFASGTSHIEVTFLGHGFQSVVFGNTVG